MDLLLLRRIAALYFLGLAAGLNFWLFFLLRQVGVAARDASRAVGVGVFG